MSLSEIYDMISAVGYPTAYRAFPEDTNTQLPFICYLLDSTRPEAADNVNHYTIATLSIEVYTETKNPSVEAQIKAILDANDFPYSTEEVWLEDERMQMTTYTTEVFIDG